MKIDKAETWNRMRRKCEHCTEFISKDEPIRILFAEGAKFPATYRGIAFHEECLREHLENLLKLT